MKEKICFWIKDRFYIFLRIILLSLNISVVFIHLVSVTIVFSPFWLLGED